MTKHVSRLLLALALMAVLLMAIPLSACDRIDNTRAERIYRLDIVQAGQTDEGVVAYVALSSNEGIADANYLSYVHSDGTFYDRQEIWLTLSPKSIYSAVYDRLAQEEGVMDVLENNRLIVIFRYDTIYKSIKSNGKVVRSGGKYVHCFELDSQSDQDTIYLTRRAANSASWYTVLAASGLILLALLTLFVVLKRNYGRRQEK